MVVAIIMVNCLNVKKKYILSIVSDNFAVSVSQEVSDLSQNHVIYRGLCQIHTF
jgi:hypothetical protein